MPRGPSSGLRGATRQLLPLSATLPHITLTSLTISPILSPPTSHQPACMQCCTANCPPPPSLSTGLQDGRFWRVSRFQHDGHSSTSSGVKEAFIFPSLNQPNCPEMELCARVESEVEGESSQVGRCRGVELGGMSCTTLSRHPIIPTI